MGEMSERVARAMYSDYANLSSESATIDIAMPDWSELRDGPERYAEPSAKAFWRKAARVAIAEMRTPTQDMRDAVYPPPERTRSIYTTGRQIWEGMIDAALSNTKPAS